MSSGYVEGRLTSRVHAGNCPDVGFFVVQIVMEYCGAGSVNDLISICHVTLTEPEIADVCASMLLGLQYLHKEHLIHRVCPLPA